MTRGLFNLAQALLLLSRAGSLPHERALLAATVRLLDRRLARHAQGRSAVASPEVLELPAWACGQQPAAPGLTIRPPTAIADHPIAPLALSLV